MIEANKIIDYLNSNLLAKLATRKDLPTTFLYKLCLCIRRVVLNGCESFIYTPSGFSWMLLDQQVGTYEWLKEISSFLAGQRFVRKWIEEDEVLQNLFQSSSMTDTELRYTINTQKIILPNTLSRLLLDTLNFEGQDQNYMAIIALKDLKEAEVFQIVLDALQNEEDEWREKAAHALPKAYILLGQFEYDIVSPLALALQDKASLVRARAARSLGRFKKPVAIQALFGAIDDVDPIVRARVVESLGRIGDRQDLNPVLISDPNSKGAYLVRSWGDLAETLSEEIVLKLIKLLKEDSSSEVQQQAKWALGRLEKLNQP